MLVGGEESLRTRNEVVLIKVLRNKFVHSFFHSSPN